MTVDEQIAHIDEQIAGLQAERERVQRRRMVKCVHCEKRTRIDRLLFVQRVEYESPYGCSGGDYYYDGEGGFACPHCDCLNRLPEKYHGDAWQHPKCEQLHKLSRYFAAVARRYDNGKVKLGEKRYKSLGHAWTAFKKGESSCG